MAGVAVKAASTFGSLLAARSQVSDMRDQMQDEVGESTYEEVKQTGTWGWAIASGFLPVQLATVPFQIAGMIFLIIIFMAVFGIGFGWSLLFAYLTQAMITAYITHKVLSVGLSIFGFGEKKYQ
jgi:hypothetical protein